MKVKVGLIGVFDMLKFKNLRRNRADVTLNTARRPGKVYVCCCTGERLAEVPTEYRDGKLLLKLDNSFNGRGVMLYELLF